MVVAVLTGIALFAYQTDQRRHRERNRRMTLVESSYQTGCLDFAKSYGLTLDNEMERARIFDTALAHCERMGTEFRRWIEREGK